MSDHGRLKVEGMMETGLSQGLSQESRYCGFFRFENAS